MPVKENRPTKSAAVTIVELTKEEQLRQRMQARRDYDCRERRRQIKFQKQDMALAEMYAAFAEKDAILAKKYTELAQLYATLAKVREQLIDSLRTTIRLISPSGTVL